MKIPDRISFPMLFDALAERVPECEDPCDVEYCFDLMCLLVGRQEELLAQVVQNALQSKAQRSPRPAARRLPKPTKRIK